MSEPYLAFPLRIGPGGPAVCDRRRHVRDVVMQVLLTAVGERLFRPDFGAGVETLVFEPAGSLLWPVVRRTAAGALAAALAGEVDPRSLSVDVAAEDDLLVLTVSYELPALGVADQARITVGGARRG